MQVSFLFIKINNLCFRNTETKPSTEMKHLSLFLFFLLCFTNISRAQVELSYCEDIDQGFGDAGIIYTPYVQFEASAVAPFIGNQITQVLIGMKSSATNVTIYIKNSPRDANALYRQTVSEGLSEGWNIIKLDTPFDITEGKDIAVGCRFRGAENNAFGYSNEKNSLADQILINQSSKWTSCGGSLCIKALVEGEHMPQHQLAIGTLPNQRTIPDADSIYFKSTVRNMGIEEVENYTLLWQVDGGETHSETFAHTIPVNSRDSFELCIPAIYDFGTHTLTLSISAINGMPDEYEGDNTATCTFTVPDERFARRVICEEYSGFWCGFCPRGMVGMELMKEEHPDRFIAIAVHGGDALEIPADSAYTYAPLINRFTGAPSCAVGRRLQGDPFYDIATLYQLESITENHIAYSMTAEWNDDASAILCHATIMSDQDLKGVKYNAAFALVEDSITGHGYYQTNYYSSNSQNYSGPFYGWEDKAYITTDVIFMDIARGCFPSFEGITLYEGDMAAMQEYTFDYTLMIPPTVLDRRQLHVVGIVIDAKTGFIQNGQNVWPEGEIPAAIEQIDADRILSASPIRLYDLGGRLVVKPAPGQLFIRSNK